MTAPLIFIIIGFVLLYMSYSISKKYNALLKNGQEAQGIVFDFESSGDDSGNSPVIRFVTAKLEWVTKKSNVSLPFLKKGDKVTVLYNPDDPQDFMIKSKQTYFLPPILAIVGLLSVLGGLYFLFFTPNS